MPTPILDSRAAIEQLDEQGVLRSIEMLPDQIEHTWQQAKTIKAAPEYANVKNIVVSGMGGSALGAHVIKTLFKQQLTVPFEVVNHYDLPEYVNEETLVVLSSYSGTTEETLASAQDAQKRKAKIAVITSGGGLRDLAEKNNYPLFLIEPKYNPSNQPRMAIGYSVFGQLALFSALGILNIQDNEVAKVVANLRANAKGLSPEAVEHNTAKFLAYSAVDCMVVLVTAEHLEGAAHVFNNQLNENAKNLTDYVTIPEMNHHYLESLSFPKTIKDQVRFFFLNSALYHPRVQARVPLTIDIAEQQGYQSEMIQAIALTKMEQVWEVIQLGAYTNFYLAMLNGINPSPIPWVDLFKEKLGAYGK